MLPGVTFNCPKLKLSVVEISFHWDQGCLKYGRDRYSKVTDAIRPLCQNATWRHVKLPKIEIMSIF